MFDDIIQKSKSWLMENEYLSKFIYLPYNIPLQIITKDGENVEIIEFTTIHEEGKGTLIDTIRGNKNV